MVGGSTITGGWQSSSLKVARKRWNEAEGMYDLESARGPFCMIVVSVFTKKVLNLPTGSICSMCTFSVMIWALLRTAENTGSHLHQHCQVFGFTLHFCSLAWAQQPQPTSHLGGLNFKSKWVKIRISGVHGQGYGDTLGSLNLNLNHKCTFLGYWDWGLRFNFCLHKGGV